ncbi:MAG: exo-alpha-sialidase [Planctomycetota bacterium]|nr:exo-alpha-sialidase [Planctomycetota bacterium]MDA1252253.1 exo-alpha-sialidase [Planctomycetota bacterium]
MRSRFVVISSVVLAATAVASGGDLSSQPGYVKSEFIYETAPFPQCHASTIVETKSGLVAAWFGGTREKDPDVGIWVSRHVKGKWSAPVEVANGVVNPQQRFPTWNPVLFQPSKGPLILYYKMGPSPRNWWGMQLTSADGGKSWSEPKRLPDGILGPIKNKPIELADGTILSGSSTEHDGWRVHMEIGPSQGTSWRATEPLNTKDELGVIQPAIIQFGQTIQILCRSQQGKLASATSKDEGKTWSRFRLLDLPNPNSGIDAVGLKDGRGLLIFNNTPRGRSPLNVAVSSDGEKWKTVLTLEDQPGEYSYPAVIQTSDGLVHVTYTWKRTRVRHVVLDPAEL